MDKLIQQYMQSMNFEELRPDTVSNEDLEALGSKCGVIIITGTTDLWVTRRLSIMDVLGVPTVFESAKDFMILDDFGMKLWDGDAASVIDYVKGFVGEKEPEFE